MRIITIYRGLGEEKKGEDVQYFFFLSSSNDKETKLVGGREKGGLKMTGNVESQFEINEMRGCLQLLKGRDPHFTSAFLEALQKKKKKRKEKR